MNPFLDQIYEQVKKATQDSVSGALFHREDFSDIIYLVGSPTTPFLQRIGTGNVKGDPHQWSEIAIEAVSGTSAYFPEGDAPATTRTTIGVLSNTLFQVGKSAKVTDKEAALYSKPGGYRLENKERLRWFREELALQMELRMMEVMNELDYIFLRGDKDTTIVASAGKKDVQCDGVLEFITNNTTDASAAALDEDLLRALGKKIHDRYKKYPDTLYVNSGHKLLIDEWVSNIWFSRDRDLEAGRNVSTYNNGFFVTGIEIEPNLPAATVAYIDHSMCKRCDLIPLGAEPLARVDTGLQRMITYYGTLEVGTDRSSGKITNLAA